MNRIVVTGLKALRLAHTLTRGRRPPEPPPCEQDPDAAARLIRGLLERHAPAMVARFGSNELNCVANYLSVLRGAAVWRQYIRGQAHPCWWNRRLIERLHRDAGFFPPEPDAVAQFGARMLRDVALVDILGSWLPLERVLERELRQARKVQLELLNPFFARDPWTAALAGRRVLVVHPFARTIERQYARREELFSDERLLPAFDLRTLQAVQSAAGAQTPHRTWFDALRWMQDGMDREAYDIALIGCGAYGLPLAAHAKRSGRIGIHMGGSLQLLFGIRGRRWEDKTYHQVYDYTRLMNDRWVKPAADERPPFAERVEGGCYW